MNFSLFSEALFALGRRHPQIPAAALRAIPRSLLLAMRDAGLRETFRRAKRSPIYRDAIAAAARGGRSVRRPDELGNFSLTPDVVKSHPESLLCGTPDLAIESSGTTDHATRIYLSRAELEYSARQGGLLYPLYGLGRGDRLLCTLDLGWGLGALLVERGLHYSRLFGMVPGRVNPVDAYERVARYGFNVLVSDPFWLARFTDIAKERGRPGRVKLLIGGGEGISERARAELERFWEAPLCMTYASTEAATILGFECLERSGYHVNEFDFYVEILDADNEGWGEIVFTTVNRRVMPLIRYRTGDVARWIAGACRCGLPFRRLSAIRGRVDEQASCAWGNVRPEFFVPILDIPELAGDWQVGLYERGLTTVAQFRMEVAGEATGHEAVGRRILSNIERCRPDAWQAYRQGLIDIDFRFFAPGTLRRRRKLLRVVDERQGHPAAWVGEAAVVTVRA